jgi:hypothetical protein
MNFRRNNKDLYNYCENNRFVSEGYDLYDEEDDLQELAQESTQKYKEEFADDVMEYLFEETVKEFDRIFNKQKVY